MCAAGDIAKILYKEMRLFPLRKISPHKRNTSPSQNHTTFLRQLENTHPTLRSSNIDTSIQPKTRNRLSMYCELRSLISNSDLSVNLASNNTRPREDNQTIRQDRSKLLLNKLCNSTQGALPYGERNNDRTAEPSRRISSNILILKSVHALDTAPERQTRLRRVPHHHSNPPTRLSGRPSRRDDALKKIKTTSRRMFAPDRSVRVNTTHTHKGSSSHAVYDHTGGDLLTGLVFCYRTALAEIAVDVAKR